MSRGRESRSARPAAPDGLAALLGDLRACNAELESQRRELKSTLGELETSCARFRSLYDGAPVPYVILSTDGLVLDANRAALELLGLDDSRRPARFEAAPLACFLVGDDVEALEEHLRAVVDTGERQSCELRVARRGGEPRITEVASALQEGTHEHDRRVRSILIDVTDRRNAERRTRALEERLQRSERLEGLGILAGGIAHDFNNLLMGVLGNAEMALASMSGDAPERNGLLQIQQAALRAADLCQRMLDSAGRGELEMNPVDVSALAAETVALARPGFEGRIRVELELARDLPAVRADAGRLHQVILNLLTNAAEAIEPDSGRIRIRTARIGRDAMPSEFVVGERPAGRDCVLIEVEDTGCGMDARTQERIFDPFFTTKFTGRGLGLASLVGIVGSHGGSLDLRSEPGRGTTFRVFLPGCAGPARSADALAALDGDRVATGTILLVDDEAAVQWATRRMLETLGYTVLVASDGAAAIELFEREAAQTTAVLVDATMPGLPLRETIHALNRLNPAVPVVLWSGFPEEQARRGCEDVRIAAFVPKPCRKAQLGAALQGAIMQGSC